MTITKTKPKKKTKKQILCMKVSCICVIRKRDVLALNDGALASKRPARIRHDLDLGYDGPLRDMGACITATRDNKNKIEENNASGLYAASGAHRELNDNCDG